MGWRAACFGLRKAAGGVADCGKPEILVGQELGVSDTWVELELEPLIGVDQPNSHCTSVSSERQSRYSKRRLMSVVRIATTNAELSRPA